MGEPLQDTVAHVLTRACVLLSFACALARRVVKNLLEHHKRFYHGHPLRGAHHYQSRRRDYKPFRTLQESWPNSSSDSYLPNKDCDEILWTGTKIYRNKWVISDNIGFTSGIQFISRAIDMIQNRGRPLIFL